MSSPERDTESEQKAGLLAYWPTQIPGRDWFQIGKRVAKNIGDHNISLIAAGVALFGMLAVFPALNVTISLYALFSSPDAVLAQVEPLRRFLPQETYELFINQLTGLAGVEDAAVNVTLLVSVTLGLWVAHKGAKALIMACNIVYGEAERRPLWNLLLVSFTFTLVGILGLIGLTLLVIILPLMLAILPVGELLKSSLGLLRWPLLALLFVGALQCVYRFAPNRRSAKWRWVSAGAVVATLLWIGASLGFTIYVQNFGNYNETYGAIGSVIVLILWFYISAFVVLLGAEINAEIERQTEVDTTVGEDRPMGERGAAVADSPPRS